MVTRDMQNSCIYALYSAQEPLTLYLSASAEMEALNYSCLAKLEEEKIKFVLKSCCYRLLHCLLRCMAIINLYSRVVNSDGCKAVATTWFTFIQYRSNI